MRLHADDVQGRSNNGKLAISKRQCMSARFVPEMVRWLSRTLTPLTNGSMNFTQPAVLLHVEYSGMLKPFQARMLPAYLRWRCWPTHAFQ